MEKGRTGTSGKLILRIGLISAAIWTILVIWLLAWTLTGNRTHMTSQVLAMARGACDKDLAYRYWAASMGGVYVPSEKVSPNPFLVNISRHAIITRDGHVLTLVNPEYMLRMVYEISQARYGYHGHMTSLKPIRPKNAPDGWERRALTQFEKGKKEVSEVTTLEGRPYLRLMRPLLTEKPCLQCHARQGYKLGQIRGGISVSVPLANFNNEMHKASMQVWFGFSSLWLIGLFGIAASTRSLNRSFRLIHLSRDEAAASEEAKGDKVDVKKPEAKKEAKG